MNDLNPSPDCSGNPFLRLKIPLTGEGSGVRKKIAAESGIKLQKK